VGYEASEPGFTLNVFSTGKLAESSYDKVVGVVSSILQVAIFEKRKEAVVIDIGDSKQD